VFDALRNFLQEMKELGPRRSMFRVGYELRDAVGLNTVPAAHPEFAAQATKLADRPVSNHWIRHLPFADSRDVANALRDRIRPDALQRLKQIADDAVEGRIFSFGRWTSDFGQPIDWHKDVFTDGSWREFSRITTWHETKGQIGDIKGVWEIARFPQAYYMSRAAAFFPEGRERWADSLRVQIREFEAANPLYWGVHWESGQEVAVRLLAWLFALDALILETNRSLPDTDDMVASLMNGAVLIERRLPYARLAVYNNHLLIEALGLFVVGSLLPETKAGQGWRALGRKLLDEASDRQFYPDGGYIQQSHNYHRVALKGLIWAVAVANSSGDRPSDSWLKAMQRSLEFLVAQQNPSDGRLPNYGFNDGSMPAILSTCDFTDFRPVLQTVSLMTRGERIYGPGPWDEMPAWILGPRVLDAPLRPIQHRSVSFPVTGYHILRGSDPSSFCFLRCGSLLDRFSQIDMLQLDVWWRGQNLLIDGGSYLYNGPLEWHNHFMRTESHNTVQVDDLDQMIHFRQFKTLYWTKAKLLAFHNQDRWGMCAGEHYGYRRQCGDCTHRRAVLYIKDDLWIVLDQLLGTGTHNVRLHWLCGEFPHTFDNESRRLDLHTPAGVFGVQVRSAHGQPLDVDVVAGGLQPPRGWHSRYYGEKIAVPSLAAAARCRLPVTFVSLLSGSGVAISVDGSLWEVKTASAMCRFSIADGSFSNISVADVKSCT
jgi:hypothetical protein